jgi:hypothetical protein
MGAIYLGPYEPQKESALRPIKRDPARLEMAALGLTGSAARLAQRISTFARNSDHRRLTRFSVVL